MFKYFERLLACCLAFTFLSGVTSSPSHRDGLKIKTSVGLLEGFVNSTTPNTGQFLGVPYAQPPVGNLRFQPPTKYCGKKGVRKAQHLGPTCWQSRKHPGIAAYESRGMGAFLNPETDTLSEDCLYLNVYAPLNPKNKKLPVIVWIDGGGFIIGGASVPYQIPDRWVERTQSHIVVTINYRLDIFGYPNAAKGTENVGLLDQRAAIEWVRDNIASFGGDSSSITLWGQSAGAFSVHYYALTYPKDPIARAFISDSGGDAGQTTDPLHTNFTSIAKHIGCGGAGAEAEFRCVAKAKAADLMAATEALDVSFIPQADDRTAFRKPAERVGQGLVAKAPWIIGSNTDEGVIKCWNNDVFKPFLDAGITTYRYLYGGNFSNVTPPPTSGALHSAELPLIFGTHGSANGKSTSFENQVSSAMQDLWLSFAQNPQTNPKTSSYIWPRFEDDNDGHMAVIAVNGTVLSTSKKSAVLDCSL